MQHYNNTMDNEYFFGFRSATDAFKSTWGLKTKALAYWHIITSLIASLSAFIDEYVFSPYQQFYIIILFLIVDYITGIAVGVKVRKESFLTRKSQRIIFLIISYSFAMWGSFLLGKHADGFFFMPYAVFYYMASVLVLSSFKNLALLGLLPKGLADFLNKYIDEHKNQIADSLKNKK
jgi:phage-related holin